jgi:phospholipid transport system substrate-binding protein
MYAKKGTIGNTPREQALNELRAAVPGLQAIAERAYALAAATDEAGPRRGIEQVGIRAADLIIAISRVSTSRSGRVTAVPQRWRDRTRTIQGTAMLQRTVLAAGVVLIAGAAAFTISAKAGTDPAAFINNLGYQLQAVNRNTSPEQRLAGFRELFREDFDIPDLGRFVLGRFWWIFAPSEQQEFLGLFEDYVVLTFSDRLSEYASNGYVPRAIGSRFEPDGVIVTSEIIRGSGPWTTPGPTVQPIRIDWRLTARDGIYRINDVINDGLSMAANGRAELEGVVERNGG